MNWFRQNRFLGTFLAIFGVALVAALAFLWWAKSGYDEAQARLNENATELARLQRLTPFPTEANLQKMKAQAQEYGADLEKLKAELKTRVLPPTPMAPNEFQSRLRQAVTLLSDKARANKVKLPENFFLGFDEFAAALPDTAAAPLLGQQLAQAELLVNILIDSRVDTLTSFKRVAAAPEASPPPGPRKPAGGPPAPSLVERNAVDVSFLAAPSAARRVLNQVTTNQQQFYIVRTVHVLNEKDKGPARDAAGTAATAAPPSTKPGAPATANAGLNFIVGNEHIQASARIEMVRFTY
jgi:hypothetical protein